MYDKQIESITDVHDFFTYLIDIESLNLHPDIEFSDYVSIAKGEKTLDDSQALHYQKLLDDAFAVCEKSGICIYDIGLKIFMSRLNN